MQRRPSCYRISSLVSRIPSQDPGMRGALVLFSGFPSSTQCLGKSCRNFLPSNSKLPRVRRARVMLPTSLASGRAVRPGEASWWARPLGMPGCRSGLCIRTRDSIFSSPSWMSFFSCGIWRLRSYSTAVRAGLRGRKPGSGGAGQDSCLSLRRTAHLSSKGARPVTAWSLR